MNFKQILAKLKQPIDASNEAVDSIVAESQREHEQKMKDLGIDVNSQKQEINTEDENIYPENDPMNFIANKLNLPEELPLLGKVRMSVADRKRQIDSLQDPSTALNFVGGIGKVGKGVKVIDTGVKNTGLGTVKVIPEVVKKEIGSVTTKFPQIDKNLGKIQKKLTTPEKLADQGNFGKLEALETAADKEVKSWNLDRPTVIPSAEDIVRAKGSGTTLTGQGLPRQEIDLVKIMEEAKRINDIVKKGGK